MGLEFAGCGVLIAEDDFAGAGDAADFVDRYAGDLGRDAFAGPRGEKEFVVFASVEGLVEVDFVCGLADAGAGNENGFEFGADVTCLADVGEVGGEAVAGVDHGGGEALLAEDAAEFEARIGEEVARIVTGLWLLPGFASELEEGGGGASEFSADEDAVAGACAGAQDGFAFGDGADDDDVGEDSAGGFGGVASGESDAVFFGEADDAAGEAADP